MYMLCFFYGRREFARKRDKLRSFRAENENSAEIRGIKRILYLFKYDAGFFHVSFRYDVGHT